MIFKYQFTNGGWVAALVSVALLGLALLLGSVVAVWPRSPSSASPPWRCHLPISFSRAAVPMLSA